jgi:hypothetical protein
MATASKTLTPAQSLALDALRNSERGKPVTPSVNRHGIKKSTLMRLVTLGYATTDENQWNFYLT